MQADQKSKITKTNIRVGLAGGLGAIIILLTLNAMGPASLMDKGLLALSAPCIAGIAASILQKRNQSSYLNFSQGIGTSIGVFTLGNFISSIFLILLETTFEPGLAVKFIIIQKERLNQQFAAKLVDKAGYDRQMEALNQFHGSSEIIKSSLISFFLFTIFALIIFIISSSIIKDERLNRS